LRRSHLKEKVDTGWMADDGRCIYHKLSWPLARWAKKFVLYTCV